jgi:hypothetical protein
MTQTGRRTKPLGEITYQNQSMVYDLLFKATA